MLVGEKVRIRAMEASDMEAVLRWMNDPEIVRSLGTRLPISRDEQEEWYQRTIKDKSKKKMIIETPDGQAVGQVSLMNIDWRNRSAEVGITIGEKDCWGQGLAADAMITVMRFAFYEWNLHRIWLEVVEYNERAIRLYERLGFVRDGLLREAAFAGNRYWDKVVMSILKPELEARYSASKTEQEG